MAAWAQMQHPDTTAQKTSRGRSLSGWGGGKQESQPDFGQLRQTWLPRAVTGQKIRSACDGHPAPVLAWLHAGPALEGAVECAGIVEPQECPNVIGAQTAIAKVIDGQVTAQAIFDSPITHAFCVQAPAQSALCGVKLDGKRLE